MYFRTLVRTTTSHHCPSLQDTLAATSIAHQDSSASIHFESDRIAISSRQSGDFSKQ